MVGPLLRGRSPTRSVGSKQHWGLRRASLRHFALARGCRRIWRGEFWFICFAGAMRLEAIGPPGRCRDGVVVIYWLAAPFNLFCHPLRARGPGRGRPVVTGSLANAIGRAKTAEGLGRAPLRHFGLVLFIPWRVGAEGIWRGVVSKNKAIADQSPLLKLSLRRVRFQRTSTRQQLDCAKTL